MADGCARAAHRDRDRAIEQATRSYESDAAREGWTEEPVYTALRVTALPSLAEQAAALLDVADEVRLQLIAELRATGAAQHERGLAEAFYRLVEAELLEPAIRYSGSTEGLYQARQREDRGLPHRESPDPTDYLRGWRPTLEYLADRDRDRGALEDAMGKVLKAWNAVTGSDVVSLWLAVDDDGGVFGMSTTSPDEALYDARYSILWNIRDIEKSSGEPYSAEDLESEANRPLDVVRVTAPSPWAMLRLLVVPACAPAVMKDQRPQLLTLLGINPENVEHLAEWGTDPVVRKTCRKLLDETPDIVGIGGAS